uniref:receptor-like protein EIX2 isoform X2 n=1 Tax=Erigeron canadensis TaxID=72917 RepID=UPI001CB8FA89|nr:receptor-like protein EIX2 isoform X2 [Erigeron canadensis]
MNNFSGQNIPEFLRSFKYLEYLNLSYSGFSGAVPHLGNLSRLQNLYLNDNDLMVKNDLGWVSLLSSLKHLDFSGITIGNHIDWFHPANMLPSLLTLNLAMCDIHIPATKLINFTSLNSLDLSSNGINSTIPVWLSNLTGLVHLNLRNNSFHGGIPDSIRTLNSISSIDLSWNQLSGPVPPSLGGLSSLKLLDLSVNQLSGSIPGSIGLLTRLQYLFLQYNEFSGNIPTSFGQLSNLHSLFLDGNELTGNILASLGQLSNLQTLFLDGNLLSGVVSEIHFTKLYNLTILGLSGNSLMTFNVSPHWIPPFQLKYFDASSCNIGPQFPNIQTSTALGFLYLRNSGIRDTIPEWFQNISSHLQRLDLSNNQIHGDLAQIIANNTGLEVVNLGNNRFNGSIPAHLCEQLSLKVMDLSNNNLSGVLPMCLGNLIQLEAIDLTNNTITGDIPSSLGSLSQLRSLHLHNNKFQGNIPLALHNLIGLETLDLGNNLLTCNIPSWIGKRLSKLRILNLQSNKLKGNIPHCFCNLTGMIMSDFNFTYDGYGYEENVEAYIKGIQLKYTKTTRFLISLDLSNNKIDGEIPDVLTKLISLKNLNLSRNMLSGHIPKNIGNIKSIESLDLSTNKLSGQIPPSMGSLIFLSYLNLSFNKLFGPIPVGNQFNTFNDPTIYEGNNRLCGKPLPRNCKESNLLYTHVGDGESKDSSHGLSWFYTGMVSGFVIGFIGFIGSLRFVRIWRIIYFEMLENVCRWLTISILVTLSRTKRKSF